MKKLTKDLEFPQILVGNEERVPQKANLRQKVTQPTSTFLPETPNMKYDKPFYSTFCNISQYITQGKKYTPYRSQ